MSTEAVAPVTAPEVTAPVVAPSVDLVAPVPPAPAPTVPPVVEDKAKGKPEPIEFEPTGDPGLDFALGFIGRAGIGHDHPAMIAAEGGDFSLLKAELGTKGIAGWEQAVALGEKAYGEASKANEARVEAVGKAVLEVAGQVGVDWEQAVVWAKANGSPDELAKVNELMADPFTAKMAALYIASNYANADGVEKVPTKAAVSTTAAPAPPVSGGPLSRAEYRAGLSKLRETMGDSYITSPQATALYRRLQK